MQSKETKPSNGLIENAVMLLRCHQNHHVPCGELHTRRTAVVGGTCGKHLVQVPEGSTQSDTVRKIAWQEDGSRVCAIRREGAGETDILRTVEQNESIQVRSVAGSEKQRC